MSDEAREVPIQDVKYFHWPEGKLEEFFALGAKIGGRNARMKFDVETRLLTLYGPGEDMKNGGGTPFNYAVTCPFNCVG